MPGYNGVMNSVMICNNYHVFKPSNISGVCGRYGREEIIHRR